MLEIRWHGRGGQGAKTASIVLGKVAAAAGKHIQAFPEYGPERMGAPVLAYTRISEQTIYEHCQIETPDLVVVLDPTLIGTVDVSAGLKTGGSLIVNTRHRPEKLKELLDTEPNFKIYTIDANRISREEIGREFPNTPVLGALNRVLNLFEEQEFLDLMQTALANKFAHRPGVIEGNLQAVARAYGEVKGL